jgi:hypothetical protein
MSPCAVVKAHVSRRPVLRCFQDATSSRLMLEKEKLVKRRFIIRAKAPVSGVAVPDPPPPRLINAFVSTVSEQPKAHNRRRRAPLQTQPTNIKLGALDLTPKIPHLSSPPVTHCSTSRWPFKCLTGHCRKASRKSCPSADRCTASQHN